MPTVVFSGGSAASGYDMGEYGPAAILQLLVYEGTIFSGTSTQVTFVSPGMVLTAQGTFANFTADGPQTGTVTSFSIQDSSSGLMTVTGISLSVASLWTWALTQDSAALEAALFGGADTMQGLGGTDTLNGGAGNDSIFSQGVAVADGGGGVDLISINLSSIGTDVSISSTDMSTDTGVTFANGAVVRNFESFSITTGAGADTFTLVGVNGTNFFSGGGGFDQFVIDLSATNTGASMDQLGTQLSVIGGTAAIDGSVEQLTVLTGTSNNTLIGGARVDVFVGQNGSDTFNGAGGNDTLNGGADADTVNLTGSAVADVADTNWNGSVITGLLNNALVDIENVNLDLGDGGAGGDWLRYNSTVGVSVDLGAGTATGFASITGVENLIGGTGGDSLTGDGGVNKINGNNGDDIITGGGGNDNLIGGVGSDTFVYAAGCGNDTINDFDAWAVGGQDFIDVSAFGINAGNFGARVAIIDTGADTVIRIDDSYFITLKNVTGDGDNSITQDDFIFGP